MEAQQGDRCILVCMCCLCVCSVCSVCSMCSCSYVCLCSGTLQLRTTGVSMLGVC